MTARADADAVFRGNFAFGLIGESRISHWLQSRGHMVMPAYEKELSHGKGPQLYSAAGNYVLPDMLVFRSDGRTLWAEAKHKSAWTWHRASQQWTTGICLQHYEHYRTVSARTGMPVWLMFWHPSTAPAAKDLEHGCPASCPAGLFGASLDVLTRCENHRSTRWGRYGMVYWADKHLRLLATVDDVEGTA